MALLSEVLTVTLSGVPFNSAQSYTGYIVSTTLSVAIIELMLIALLVILFKRRGPVLPYKLDRIMSVLMYLCNSSLPRDFGDLWLLDTEMRNRRILELRKKYKYGTIATLDAGIVYGVEYDSSVGQLQSAP